MSESENDSQGQETRDPETPGEETVVSALVVLRPADGRELTGTEIITSENVAEFLPDPDVAGEVMEYFRSQGFEVQPSHASSFSITGSESLFNEFFAAELRVEAADGVVRSLTTADGGRQLASERIPEEMAGSIVSIEFEAPPDFGPFDY